MFGVDFELKSGFFSEDPHSGEEIYFSVKGRGHRPKGGQSGGLAPKAAERTKILPKPESLESYRRKFETTARGLVRGDSYLVNLTLQTPIECDLSLEEIFLASDAPYSLYLPGRFVCFSPERFVAVDGNGTISTCPMKGTINAAVPGAEKIILDDFKESAEHATVVDLLRNDLTMSALKVRVERYRYVERVKTSEREILQVSSDVRGELGP
ncbi:MAG: chorismate-binding protein, partial [Deltaproteobacteria bacterium]|nr:chorismate-binding protein [Deltaproteobacteria bacterium]